MYGDIEIRALMTWDLAEMDAFWTLVLENTFLVNQLMPMKELLSSEIVLKKQMGRESLKAETETICLIARDGNTIVGAVTVTPSNQDILDIVGNAAHAIREIGSSFTHPDFRGKGLAGLLWYEALLILKRAGEQRVAFDSGYPMAQRLWQSRFGPPQYFVENHWGEDAHHMVWVLSLDKAQDAVVQWIKHSSAINIGG